jgi:hypothetical protein
VLGLGSEDLNWLGGVVFICNPSYLGGGDSRIAMRPALGKNAGPYRKIIKTERTGGMA